MKNIFSLEQISKTGSLDNILIVRQYQFDLTARFMEIKNLNPNIRQDQTTKELGCSSSTLERYKNDINMLLPYRILSNNTNKKRQKVSNTNFDDNSRFDRDVKRPQRTSNDLN